MTNNLFSLSESTKMTISFIFQFPMPSFDDRIPRSSTLKLLPNQIPISSAVSNNQLSQLDILFLTPLLKHNLLQQILQTQQLRQDISLIDCLPHLYIMNSLYIKKMHYYIFIDIVLIFVQMDNQEGYRFKFKEEEKWRKYLDEEGFVVIENWISSEECQQYVDDFWEIMEILSDGALDRNKPESQVLSKSYPPVLHGGMVQYVAHSKPQWQLRKKARPLFQKLWECNKVKSSFDGFCFMNGNRNYQEKPINSFLHCDQSPTINKIWSYQGVQCLTNSGQDQGGFVVVPKSNHFHRQYFEQKKMLGHKSNWYLVPPQDKQDQQSTFHHKKCLKVNTKAGDFILWNSRTFHCNTVPKVKTLRVCTYICMLPEEHIAPKTKVLRQIAAKNYRVSNHHPGDGFKTFPVFPRYLTNQKVFEELLNKVNTTIFDEQIKELL